MKKEKTPKQLLKENEDLRIRLQEAEDTLEAIREGAVDAVIVSSPKGEQVFTLSGEDVVYRRLVETMHEAGLTTTPEGQILFCNKRFAAMLKRPMAEIIGQPFENFVQKSNHKNMAALLVSAQVKPTRKRLIFLAKDGTYVPARVSANLLQQEDSASICLVATDMTELETSEEIIRQINEQRAALHQNAQELGKLNRVLRALSNSNQMMMHAEDESAYLKEACNIIEKDCGYAMVWIGFAEDDEAKSVRPMAYAGFEQGYLETLKISWADNKRGWGPTGTSIRTAKVSMCSNMLTDPAFEPWRKEALKRGYASSIALPLLSNDKAFGSLTIYSKEPDPFTKEEVDLLVELASDLSYGIIAIRSRVEHKRGEEQLKQFSEELKRSNSDLEQYAYVASHDLREPLRAINGFMELLYKVNKDKLEEKSLEYIKYAIDGAIRMDNLLSGLLQYSRVQTHGKAFGPIPMQAALKTALANLRENIEETGAVVTSDELPEVKADGMQIIQLFQNLIANAIKFKGPQKPQIHVGCQKLDAQWQFSVHDNGIGIDPQFNEQIFLMFQRLHTRDIYPGYGIGLSICKRIIDRHGGRIWVESQPDKGATFYFTIPE